MKLYVRNDSKQLSGLDFEGIVVYPDDEVSILKLSEPSLGLTIYLECISQESYYHKWIVICDLFARNTRV